MLRGKPALLILIFWLLAACSQTYKPTQAVTPGYTPTVPAPSPSATSTKTPPSSPTPTPFPPTPTPERIDITATVWTSDPKVPVIVYHQFQPDSGSESHALKVRLSDFRAQLQSLYDSGFSLVSLEDWLDGRMAVANGRRPLIISMDDLFFNNQIGLTKDGEPDPKTGIGVLWQFYKEHPDFGFHIALFINLGDKLYGNPDKPDWQESLARTIVWCIEHDAIPYNHFYTHPMLVKTPPQDITWEAEMNDNYLRKLLGMVNRQDLIDRIGNLFALPYGQWPDMKSGVQAILDYKNPEGKPVKAVMEIDYIAKAKYLAPIYSPDLDRMHLPRIVASKLAIDTLVKNKDNFQVAQECNLSLEKDRWEDNDYVSGQIQELIRQGVCQSGIYSLQGRIFRAQVSKIDLIFP